MERGLTALHAPVAGNVITGETLYCQRDYCQQLLDAGGDYLVIVKKNQRELYDAIALAFAEPVWGAQYRQARRRGRHGGRWETRQLRATEALNEYLDWPGVRQVCQVRRRVEQKGSVSMETRYAITSLGRETGPGKLLEYVRGHWGIEPDIRRLTILSPPKNPHYPDTRTTAAYRNAPAVTGALWRRRSVRFILTTNHRARRTAGSAQGGHRQYVLSGILP